MSIESNSIFHGFSVIRVLTDKLSQTSIPIGVVAWDMSADWYTIRVVKDDETVKSIKKWHRLYVNLAYDQLMQWAQNRELPYFGTDMNPASSSFWESVSKLLTVSVLVDEPRAMDPMQDYEMDTESLYEAVVQPYVKSSTMEYRVDGALTKALGKNISSRLQTKIVVKGYKGANVTVRRGYVTNDKILIIDGVNLAAQDATSRADELVSKLLRIRNYTNNRHDIDFIIGYTASPGGLNGELHMKEWIQEMITPRVYDLTKEKEKLQHDANSLLSMMQHDDFCLSQQSAN